MPFAAATKNNSDNDSTLLKALKDHHVTAKVVDCDHYRIRGGLAVETDFIVTVKPSPGNTDFEAFTISKTYSAFRTLAQLLKQAADQCLKQNATEDDLPASVIKLTKYCHLASHLIDAQRTAYLGKVNYMYVKVLAKQRKQIIEDVLSATCNYFPTETTSHPLLQQVANIIEMFFLTDHVVMLDDPNDDDDAAAPSKVKHERTFSTTSLDNLNPLAWVGMKGYTSKTATKLKTALSVDTATTTTTTTTGTTTATTKGSATVVIPMTRRNRRSGPQRDQEEEELSVVGKDAMLLMDDDRPAVSMLLPNYATPVPTVRAGGTAIGSWMEENPWTFIVIFVASVAMLQSAADCTVTMDGDIFMLCIFASFCLGLHTPRPMVGGFDRPPSMKGTVRIGDRSGRKLLRRSMIGAATVTSPMSAVSAGLSLAQAPIAASVTQEQVIHEEELEEGPVMQSPMAVFPPGAEIGTHLNCWSSPDTSQFLVRGPKYLSDKKKVPSGEYLFPCRGVDLFLTDACPQDVGRNAGIMGGRLRDVPTFIINFRLPWGVLLLYCEIPSKFVRFVEASTAGDAEIAKLMPVLKEMTPPERTTARWLMGDTEEKNKTLKIVPVVVDGPWVVKSVVGGKPALIGAKLPINYFYQPAEGKDALYLEADLDIAASSAARGILSVARSYTQVLTINLGFVIQGNEADELPEQMLTGARLHGIDPLTAPSLPPMADDLVLHLEGSRSDDESV